MQAAWVIAERDRSLRIPERSVRNGCVRLMHHHARDQCHEGLCHKTEGTKWEKESCRFPSNLQNRVIRMSPHGTGSLTVNNVTLGVTDERRVGDSVVPFMSTLDLSAQGVTSVTGRRASGSTVDLELLIEPELREAIRTFVLDPRMRECIYVVHALVGKADEEGLSREFGVDDGVTCFVALLERAKSVVVALRDEPARSDEAPEVARLRQLLAVIRSAADEGLVRAE